MTTQHTTGEWHTNSGQVYSLDDTRGATIALVSDHYGPDVQQANARLIAAAPDLLEACKLAYQLITDNPDQTERDMRVIDTIVAAIFKAHGE